MWGSFIERDRGVRTRVLEEGGEGGEDGEKDGHEGGSRVVCAANGLSLGKEGGLDVLVVDAVGRSREGKQGHDGEEGEEQTVHLLAFVFVLCCGVVLCFFFLAPK